MMRVILAALLFCTPVLARDYGQWEHEDPAIVLWFQKLLQPDTKVSCCGSSDAYWADEAHITSDGRIVATITDDREDAPLMRSHVPIGTRYIVPPNKITHVDGNPTGHVIIFLGGVIWANGNIHPEARSVLCYVQNGGV